jgi:hypothetical protein
MQAMPVVTPRSRRLARGDVQVLVDESDATAASELIANRTDAT